MDEQQKARPDPFNARLKALLAAVALVGLLLAVAGTMPAETAMESLSGRIVVDLPSWLGLPFVVLMCLATLYIFVLMAPGMRVRERRVAATRGRSALGLAVILLLVAFWPGFREQLALDIDNLLRGLGQMRGSAMSSAGPGTEAPAVQSAVVDGILETLLLALCLIGFGLLAWLTIAILPSRDREAPSPTAPDALQVAVEESLDDLRNMPDARLAIIRCYDRFERALAGVDVRRAPWQTAMEFMRTALDQPRLPRESVRALTYLFERARFSQHAMGPQDRERAWHALVAVKEALDGVEGHAVRT
ncbi:MAG: DUF4129 domain-containing protein [Reyranellaceae bacterium]